MSSCHNHCTSCYRTKCTHPCPIIPCPKSCSHLFHQCKSEDHFLICQKSLVSCLNSFYGCPYEIPRHKMAAHLLVCPASVVHCCFKWYRAPLDGNATPFTHCVFETPVTIPQVDIALTLKDQQSKFLDDIKKSSTMQKVLKVKLNINGDNEKFLIEKEIKEEKENQNTIETLKIEKYPSSRILHLDSNINAQPLSGTLQTSDVSFMCNEVIRRDGFCHHFRNLHSELQAWSDHWVDQRCPLSIHGCTFSQSRLRPQGAFLIFDTQYHQFRVAPQLHATQSQPLPLVSFPKKSDFNVCVQPAAMRNPVVTFNISHLPQLLLHRILSFLDSYDLHSLSLVSVDFRHHCEGLLRRKGMVELRWEKVLSCGASRWKTTAHVWRFPSGFNAIDGWEFCKTESLSKHLSSCPFNVKKLYDERVPIMQTNNEMTNFNYSAYDEANNEQNVWRI